VPENRDKRNLNHFDVSAKGLSASPRGKHPCSRKEGEREKRGMLEVWHLFPVAFAALAAVAGHRGMLEV